MTRKIARAGVGVLVCSLAACGDGKLEIGTAGSVVGRQQAAVTGGICPGPNTVQGVDVSMYQGSVNWSAVKAAGNQFAIARVSDGSYQDPTFGANWAAMKSAGLIRGAYQFFEAGDDPTAQANDVIAQVGRLGSGDLPVMLDMEVTDGQSAATIVSHIHTWVDAITAGTGKQPFIYTGAYFWDDSVGSSDFAALALDVAWYGTNCPGVPDAWAAQGWTFHQFTSTGSISGIAGDVDVDLFNGSLATLTVFAGGAATPPRPCTLAGASREGNTCTETLQCDEGTWVPRSNDPSSCMFGVLAGGACLTDTGAVDAQNTCTATLQCDDGVWVARSSDPSSCLGSSSPPATTSCTLGGKSYAQQTCTETLQCDSGAWVARSADPTSCLTGIEAGGACLTDTGAVDAQDTCTATLQCDNGVWVDRIDDPASCLGATSTSCTLAGKTYAQNTCTETLQCDSGDWVARSSDPSTCNQGVEANGACLTDTGAVDAQNTCTATLQCDDGVWLDRIDDPAACLGSTSTSCTLAGKTYAQNTCTETLQCDSGDWVARSSDPSTCNQGVEAGGACLTDTGAVDAQNTCTATLQCDDGVWVDRADDPSSCL